MSLFLMVVSLFLFLLPVVSTAQWRRIDGVDGGASGGLVSDGSRAYFSSGGVCYVRTEADARWRPVDAPIRAVFVERGQTCGVTWTRTNQTQLYVFDAGTETWSPWAGVVPGAVATVVETGAGLLAGGGVSRATYLSTDRGATWERVQDGVLKDGFSSLHDVGGTLYVRRTDQSLLRSTDGGGSWEPYLGGVSRFVAKGDSLAIHHLGKIRVSVDGGARWRDASVALPLVAAGLLCDGVDIYAEAQTQDRGRRLFRLAEWGSRWEPVQESSVFDHGSRFMAVATLGGTLLADAREHGLWSSTDAGASWRYDMDGIPAVSPTSLVERNGEIYVGSLGSGLFRSTDGGTTWEDHAVAGILPNTIYRLTATSDGGILVSGDRGCQHISNNGTVTTVGPQTTVYATASLHGRAYVLRRDGLYVYSPGVGGFSWGLDWTTPTPVMVPEAAPSMAGDGTHLYCITGDTIAVSSDTGRTFSRNLAAWFYTVATDGVHLYTGGERRIAWSTDHGVTWAGTCDLPWPITGFSHGDKRYGGTILIRNGTVYVSVLGGVAVAPVGSCSWTFHGDPSWADQRTTFLAVNDTTIYAGRAYGGLWAMPLSSLADVREHHEATPFTILPNPVDDVLDIVLAVPSSLSSTVEIVDGTGRVTLTGRVEPGTLRVTVPTAGLAPGVYGVRTMEGNSLHTGIFIKR